MPLAASLPATPVRPFEARHPWRATAQPRLQQVAWFAGVSVIAFLVPLVLSSWLGLQHDVYYFCYFTVVATVLGAYVRASHIDLRAVLADRRRLSLVLGVASAAFVTWSVLARIAATPHPSGAYFMFEIGWRGVAYGVCDALLLSAFPGLVARELMHRNVAGAPRRAGYAALTLALVMIITAAYHAGYKDLQNAAGIRQPEIGNSAISIPVIVTANPVGSVLAHVSMHLAAVTHCYESKDRLPPQVFVGSRN